MRPLPAGPRRGAAALTWLTWVLAAVVATTVAWWAVSAVGRAGGGDGAQVLSQDDVAQELADRGTASPVATATAAPVPRTTPTPSVAPTGATPTAVATTPPAAAEVVRAWDVTGGQVGASCTGAAITLLYATPSDGWAVEIKHSGPEQLEVELRRGEAETRVRAACVAGTPEQTTESVDDQGGSSGGSDD